MVRFEKMFCKVISSSTYGFLPIRPTKRRSINLLFFSVLLVIWFILISIPFANAQVNNESGTVYLITEKSLEDLKSDVEVPDDILKKLQNLKDNEYIGKEKFIGALKEKIVDSLIIKYKSSILKYVDTRNLEIKDLRVTKIDGNLLLNGTIKVTVNSLKEWIKQGNKYIASDFILYIDGKAFKGLALDSPDENGKLQFELKFENDSINKKTWTTIVSRKQKKGNMFKRIVPITVGIKAEIQMQSNTEATLIKIKEGWFYGFLVVIIIGIILFIRLAGHSDIIRVSGPSPKNNRKPYSLARTQMAFWFFIVIISYVFIWMVTDDLTNLTPAVLALIGISSATGLGAAVVDSSKRSDQQNQRQNLEEKKETLEVEEERLNSEISTLTDDEQANKKVELAGKQMEINQMTAKINKITDSADPIASTNFIKDILSDDKGVSFHRFQIFIWTIVLIIIFITSVYNKLIMPDFDSTLLALMGISSGTYIGFKLPDQQG